MRAGGPDFLAVDAPAFRRFARRRPHGREIRTGAGFGQADAGVEFTPRNAGQISLALLLAAIAQDQRTGLSIGDPMRADGCARRKQFLDHDIAFERVAIAAAVARREGHSDIARRAERAARSEEPTSE